MRAEEQPRVHRVPSATPDLVYPERTFQTQVARPSWSANLGYLDDGHRVVFEETKDIPGWQMEGDSYKLYEMAHFAGDVILELGTYGGRSAVVELRGALSNSARIAPQFFGIDLDPEAIPRSHASLRQFGLAEHALLFHGTVQDFARTFPIRPTMVFVDADHKYEGVQRDLAALAGLLPPGVPVLCHDYCDPKNNTGEYGVRQAATEWEQAGYANFLGVFGCAALLVTTDKCRAGDRSTTMSPLDFAAERERLLQQYGLAPDRP
jgi:Methyltransferase domain